MLRKFSILKKGKKKPTKLKKKNSGIRKAERLTGWGSNSFISNRTNCREITALSILY
jgi:hypothetical protein